MQSRIILNNMKQKNLKEAVVILSLLIFNTIYSQTDSIEYLKDITLVGQNSNKETELISDIVGTNIYSGKKNTLLIVDNVQGNVSTNTMRQIAAKIPGIHIWESDGSGIQIGISTRGLSPNRSWEFNVRQNGYDISADPFGYPEAYYNPQMQAVQRIEVIKGAASLQYGPQFGGMINYVLRNGSNFTKPFQMEIQQTFGSSNLVNSFVGLGGKTEKVQYYTFFDHRNADGYRTNSKYKVNTAYATATAKITDKVQLTTEFTYWDALSQQPGGITDEEFQQNQIQKSHRSRNWFNLIWRIGAISAKYQITDKQKVELKTFAVIADRKSIGFMPSTGIITADEINPTTLQYNNRTLDIDNYTNFGAEIKYLNQYKIANVNAALSAGVRLYKGNTERYRNGKGSTNFDADFSLTNDGFWGGEIDFSTKNNALFIEHLFSLGKFIIVPGFRAEYIKGEAEGYNGYANNQPIVLQNQQKSRSFLLFGTTMEYHISKSTELYGSYTQAYRPIQFADLVTPPTTDVLDPNLKDAKGYNFDIGYRGNLKDFLQFDFSIFYLKYNNRIGTIKQQNIEGNFYNYKTNIGSSFTKGLEAFAHIEMMKIFSSENKNHQATIYASYSYNNAAYNNLRVVTLANNQLTETNYKDKKIENAPENILRIGAQYGYKKLLFTIQSSYVSRVYSDANNTEEPTLNAQNGKIPSYNVWDTTLAYKTNKSIKFKAGINNLFDEKYFTRRASGYPGPGILPADGRNFFVSINYIF